MTEINMKQKCENADILYYE